MGITLKAARINKGLNQKDAARAIGIAVDTLSKYERGLSYPDVPVISRIETVYGIEYRELIFLPHNYGLNVKHSASTTNVS